MFWSDTAEVYKQRKPGQSPLWRLFDEHVDDRRKAEEVGENYEEKKADQSDVIVVSGFNPKKVPLLVWRECIKNEESRSSLTWGGLPAWLHALRWFD